MHFVDAQPRATQRVEAQPGVDKELFRCGAPLKGECHKNQEILAGYGRFHTPFGHK